MDAIWCRDTADSHGVELAEDVGAVPDALLRGVASRQLQRLLAGARAQLLQHLGISPAQAVLLLHQRLLHACTSHWIGP